MIVYDELQSINTSKILDKCLVLSKLNQSIEYKFALSGTPMQNDTTEFFVNYCFFHNYELLNKAKKENLMKQESWETNESFKTVRDELKSKRFYFFGGEETNFKVDEKFVPLLFSGEHQKNYKNFSNKSHQQQMQYLLNPKDFNAPFDSAKMLFVKQFVKELSLSKEKVIIFSYYKNPLRYLYNELKKYKPIIAIGNSNDENDVPEYIREQFRMMEEDEAAEK